ncbi:hypothetical protein ScalyP_jg9647 [Parmales sp. scaly parma]|nr:hypothetical protein ScalyP_jg9647 [Parmales sp. scaly parma]
MPAHHFFLVILLVLLSRPSLGTSSLLTIIKPNPAPELNHGSVIPITLSFELDADSIVSANLQLCIHSSTSPNYIYCDDRPISETIFKSGSLYQPDLDILHVLTAWLIPFLPSTPTSLPSTNLSRHLENAEHSTFTSFVVSHTTAQLENLQSELIHASNTNNAHFTKTIRSNYFNLVYNNEVWSHPDPKSRKDAARSGSGSTIAKTSRVREFLEHTIAFTNAVGLVDIPCGDLNWITSLSNFSQLDYFGGDVSSVVVNEHKENFKLDANKNFGLVDLVDDDLLAHESINRLFQNANDNESDVIIVVRQLMQHLSNAESLQIIKNLEELQVRTSSTIHVMLTTHLRGNGNGDKGYLLATGHKINLFQPPFCVVDPERLVWDGMGDMFLGMWTLNGASRILGNCESVV